MESPSNLKMERKPSTGRRKIEMKLIEGESARQVTFSKRRNGLFKKASELSILCGIEVAIIVFSTSGKVYTFGHPCVDSVIGRFLTQGSTPSPVPYNLNREYIELLNQLEAESKHAEMLKLLRKQQGGDEHDDDLHELNLFELMHLNASMQELRKKVGKRIVELTISNHTSSPSSILDVNDMKIYGCNNASSLGHRVFGFDIERRLF